MDLIALALRENHITFTRLDGRLSPKVERILLSLNNPSYVLYLSLIPCVNGLIVATPSQSAAVSTAAAGHSVVVVHSHGSAGIEFECGQPFVPYGAALESFLGTAIDGPHPSIWTTAGHQSYSLSSAGTSIYPAAAEHTIPLLDTTGSL